MSATAGEGQHRDGQPGCGLHALRSQRSRTGETHRLPLAHQDHDNQDGRPDWSVNRIAGAGEAKA